MAKPSAKPSVPQVHGGALVPGAGGGKENGSLGGRPPSYIREVARKSFFERIPILEQIADSAASADKDRIAAIKVLGDTGGVDKLALTVEEQPEEKFDAARAAEVMAQVGAFQSLRKIEQILTAAANGSGDS